MGMAGLVLLMLSMQACSSPYAEGKSAADIPAQIDVVDVKQISLVGGTESNGDPKMDLTPSQNDQEVLAVAKRAIMNQLGNYGYKIVEGPQHSADVEVRFFVNYMPERWPLVDRSVSVLAILDDQDGKTMFKANAFNGNSAGLIGAAIGSSRDEMVASTAQQAVVTLVTEMQKGTKDNKRGQQSASTAATPDKSSH
jgi:hypothetical protein